MVDLTDFMWLVLSMVTVNCSVDIIEKELRKVKGNNNFTVAYFFLLLKKII